MEQRRPEELLLLGDISTHKASPLVVLQYYVKLINKTTTNPLSAINWFRHLVMLETGISVNLSGIQIYKLVFFGCDQDGWWVSGQQTDSIRDEIRITSRWSNNGGLLMGQRTDVGPVFVQRWTKSSRLASDLSKAPSVSARWKLFIITTSNHLLTSWGTRRRPRKHDTLTQCRFNVGPASQTIVQHWTNIGSVYRVDRDVGWSGTGILACRAVHVTAPSVSPH